MPFFFVRVDPAGNVSKRFSAAGFPFARYGGSCPRWVVHTAFSQPGAVQVQVAELPDGETRIETAHRAMTDYRKSLDPALRPLLDRYRLVDASSKAVGVGSVGTRCWIALLVGRHAGDPLILQFKEAEASVLEQFLSKSMFKNHGRRVVVGQRITQATSDIMLGWVTATGLDGIDRDFYVRQLWDAKGSAVIESMSAAVLGVQAHNCGWTLARAHAVSGDPVAIAAYLGNADAFDTAIADFAAAYADQNQRDFDSVKARTAAGSF